MEILKSRAALIGLASLFGVGLLGSVALAALPPAAQPASAVMASTETDEDDDDDRPKPPKLADLLQKLVEGGMITAAQRDLVLEAVKQATEQPKRKKTMRPFHVVLTDVNRNAAAYIGIDEKTLREELRAGKSLAEIALARGKTREGLIAAISAAALARIEEALKAGPITAEQATKAKAQVAERAAKVVDAKHKKPEPKERGDSEKFRFDKDVRSFIGNVLQAAERYLGIGMGDLQEALHAGRSLGEIANATPGKSRDGLILALATAANAKIDAAKAGKLTAEQATALKAKAAEAIAKAVDAKRKAVDAKRKAVDAKRKSVVPGPSLVVPAPSFPGLVLPNATGPVPPGFARYGGRVTDATSGLPVVGACVYAGPPAGCPLGAVPRTDTNGNFWIDLPAGSGWAFNIEHPAYKAVLSRRISPGATDDFTMTRKP